MLPNCHQLVRCLAQWCANGFLPGKTLARAHITSHCIGECPYYIALHWAHHHTQHTIYKYIYNTYGNSLHQVLHSHSASGELRRTTKRSVARAGARGVAHLASLISGSTTPALVELRRSSSTTRRWRRHDRPQCLRKRRGNVWILQGLKELRSEMCAPSFFGTVVVFFLPSCMRHELMVSNVQQPQEANIRYVTTHH